MTESQKIDQWIESHSQLFEATAEQRYDSKRVGFIHFDNKLSTMLSDARKQATIARMIERGEMVSPP